MYQFIDLFCGESLLDDQYDKAMSTVGLMEVVNPYLTQVGKVQ